MSNLKQSRSWAAVKFRKATMLCGATLKPMEETQKAGNNFLQSSAQVESSVAPNSGELKLEGRVHRKKRSKDNRIHPRGVRFTQPELAALTEKAKAAGCSVNGYIRASALGSDYKPPQNEGLRQALVNLNFELTKQGTNLNQIAKHLNAGLSGVAEAEGVLYTLMPSYLRTLGKVRMALSQGEPMP